MLSTCRAPLIRLLTLGALVLQPVSGTYVRRTSGSCSDVGDIIRSQATCNAAAMSLGLPDTTSMSVRVSDWPTGCYETPTTNGGVALFFNTFSTISSCRSDAACICQSAAGNGQPGNGGNRQTSSCTNTCHFSSDDECDDGGTGAEFDACGFGTDCIDCGTRDTGDSGDTDSFQVAAWIPEPFDNDTGTSVVMAGTIIALIVSALWWGYAYFFVRVAEETEAPRERKETTEVNITRLTQLWPSAAALQRQNSLEQALLWLDVWCISMRWAMLLLAIIFFMSEFELLSISCPPRAGAEKSVAQVIEFALDDRYLTNCGDPWVPANWSGPSNDNACRFASDGDCDDGGLGSSYSFCTCGSDQTDWGTRTQQECSTKALVDRAQALHSDSNTSVRPAMLFSVFLWLIAKMYGLREKGKGQGHVCACKGMKKTVNFLDGCLTGDGSNFLLALITGVQWDSNVYRLEYTELQSGFATFLYALGVIVVIVIAARAGLHICTADESREKRKAQAEPMTRWVIGILTLALMVTIIIGAYVTFRELSAFGETGGNFGAFILSYFGYTASGGGALSYLFGWSSAMGVMTSCIEKIKWILGRQCTKEYAKQSPWLENNLGYDVLEGFTSSDSIFSMVPGLGCLSNAQDSGVFLQEEANQNKELEMKEGI